MIKAYQNVIPEHSTVRKPIAFGNSIESRNIKMTLTLLGVIGLFSIIGDKKEDHRLNLHA